MDEPHFMEELSAMRPITQSLTPVEPRQGLQSAHWLDVRAFERNAQV